MKVSFCTPVSLLKAIAESLFTVSYFCINDHKFWKAKNYIKKLNCGEEFFGYGNHVSGTGTGRGTGTNGRLRKKSIVSTKYDLVEGEGHGLLCQERILWLEQKLKENPQAINLNTLFTFQKNSSYVEINFFAIGCRAVGRFNNRALIDLWKEGKLIPIFPGDKKGPQI